MTYVEFKQSIHAKLRGSKSGMTWLELKQSLDLPYERPCPEWLRRLEKEIGLVRRKGPDRALTWNLR